MTTGSLLHLSTPADIVRLVVVLSAMTALAVLVHHVAGLGNTRATAVAAVRAAVQLAVVGLVIAAVLGSWALTCAFVALMWAIASVTAGRRVQDGGTWWTALPVGLGALPVGAALVAAGLVPATSTAVVPVLGILVGNAMTATTLAGTRMLDAMRTRRGEYEAGLSIGLADRDARLLVARDDAALALVPGLDQTRTVGLVTLPGAFVGTLLGGATPMAAAAVQLVVLVALLLVQAVAVTVMTELVARGHVPAEPRTR